MLAHIVNGVLRTKVSEEIIYTKEYCVHWYSWLMRLNATAGKNMEMFVCNHFTHSTIGSCRTEVIISHWKCVNFGELCGFSEASLPPQSLSDDNLLQMIQTRIRGSASQWGWKRAFVVVVVIGGDIGSSGGQEVAGVEACVHDKWSDRCVCGDGSTSGPISPSVFGWWGLRGWEGSFPLPEGETKDIRF